MTDTERLLRHTPSDAEIRSALRRAGCARNRAYWEAFQVLTQAVRGALTSRPFLMQDRREATC